MSNKKSFILHKDALNVLDELTDDQAGKLFKAIRDYQNGNDLVLDFGLKMAFLPFKNQFIRDGVSYLKTVERNKANGSKGGRPKNPVEPKETQKTQSVNKEPKKPDSGNDNDSDKDKEEIKSVFTFDDFWKMYPNKTAKKAAELKYKNVTEANRQIIKDTLNNFINNKPFESYTIPNPATYIFNERWTDEITIKDKVHSSGVILGLDVLYQAASVTGGMQRLSDKYGYTLEELKEMYNAALIKGGHKPVNND